MAKRWAEVRAFVLVQLQCTVASDTICRSKLCLQLRPRYCVYHAVPDLAIHQNTCASIQTSAQGEEYQRRLQAFVDELKSMPVAVQTLAANEQHYEVQCYYKQQQLTG